MLRTQKGFALTPTPQAPMTFGTLSAATTTW